MVNIDTVVGLQPSYRQPSNNEIRQNVQFRRFYRRYTLKVFLMQAFLLCFSNEMVLSRAAKICN